MPFSEEQRRHRIELIILAYLGRCPAARDTAGGIHHWWLRDEAGVSACVVKEALTELVRQGWMDVREITRVGGEETQVYGIQTGRIDAIRSYLAQPSNSLDETESSVLQQAPHAQDENPEGAEERQHG